MNWIDTYINEYKQKLNQRSPGGKRGLKGFVYDRSQGFQIIFEELLKIKENNFNIIETGTLRNPGKWKDGNSGFLFAEFVKLHGGYVKSVDIDQKAVDTANKFAGSDHYTATCSDSVSWLQNLQNLNSIDLFYLDSMDVKFSKDQKSAEHHLKEFKAIEPYITKDTIVAIDDNSFLLNGTRAGKGRMIVEYLDSKGIKPIFDDYQIVYRF